MKKPGSRIRLSGKIMRLSGIPARKAGLDSQDVPTCSIRRLSCVRKKNQNLRLSANLRWLQQQGTSLAALGKKISTPTSTISAWSNGAIPTDHSALLRLAKNLDCSLERLLFGDLSVSEKPAQVDLNELFSGKFVVEIKARKLPSDQ